MDINMTLIGQAIAMTVFVAFCMKYVWPFIMSVIEERQTQIADGLAAAEQGQSSLANAKTEADKILAASARPGAWHRRSGQLARERHRRSGASRR